MFILDRIFYANSPTQDLSSYKEISWIALFSIYLLNILILWKKGFTLGKLILKIQVISEQGLSRSLLRIVIRETFGKFISLFGMGLGYFWAIWDTKGQAWHDKIAKTLVVSLRPEKNRRKLSYTIMVLSILAQYGLVIIIVFIQILITTGVWRALTASYMITKSEQINKTLLLAKNKPNNWLCGGNTAVYCEGDSRSQTFFSRPDWIKANLNDDELESVKPLSNKYSDIYFKYCSDNKDWEIEVLYDIEKAKKSANLLGISFFATDFAINQAAIKILGLGLKTEYPLVYRTGSSLDICLKQ